MGLEESIDRRINSSPVRFLWAMPVLNTKPTSQFKCPFKPPEQLLECPVKPDHDERSRRHK
jgi:hypothetical protein